MTLRHEATFVGRDAELGRLDDAMERGALVSVVGPPGVGKTRLVRTWARERATHVVRLAQAVNDDEILPLVAEAIGMSQVGVQERDEFLDRIARYVTDDEVVFLDNAEHVQDGVEAFCRALREREAECPIVVTSRHGFGDDFARIGLQPLERDHAVQLVSDVYERVWGAPPMADDQPAIEALVELVDGVPLALEITAARFDVMRPDVLVERLRRRFEAAGEERAGLRGLREAFDGSWLLLNEDERRVLTALTVFEETFDLRAVEAVAGEDRWWADVVARLVHQSLIVRERTDAGDVRFRMLRSVRYLTREKADPEAIEEAGRAHAAHYAERAAYLGPALYRDPKARAPFEFLRDWPNMRVALRRLRGVDETTRLRMLVELAHGLVLFGRVSLDRFIRDARHALVSVEDERLRGQALTTIGNLELLRGDLEAARRAAGEAVGVLPEETADRLEAEQLQAMVERGAGNRDRSLTLLEELVPRFRELGDTLQHAIVLVTLSSTLYEAGRADDGVRMLERAVSMLETAYGSSSLGLVEPRIELALGYFGQGAYERAAELAGLAAQTSHRFDATVLEASALDILSGALLALGECDESLRAARQALTITRRGGFGPMTGHNHVQAAWASYFLGDVDGATEHLARSGPSSGTNTQARAALLRATIATVGRRDAEATAAYEQAQRLAEASEGLQPPVELFHAGHLAMTGDLDGARELLDSYQSGPRRARDAETVRDVFDIFVERAASSVADAVAQARERLGEDAGPYVQLAAAWLEGVATRPETDAAPVRVASDGRRARLGLEELDLHRRRAIPGILACLVAARLDQPGEPVPLAELVEAGWPEETMAWESAVKRLHTAIWTLRKLGFDEVLVTYDDGYLLAEHADVDWLD